MYLPFLLIVATVILLIAVFDWYKEIKADLSSYITVSGILGALFFMAVGVSFLSQEHSRIGTPELVFNVVVFFVFVPVACLWVRRKKGSST